MAVWPLQDSGVIEQGGLVAATSIGVVVTASGTAHTKGSWTEVVTATVASGSELLLLMKGATAANATDTSALFDVGFGGSGSEFVVVADLQCGGLQSAATWVWRFPLRVPAGTRISLRCQSAVVSATLNDVQAYVVGGGWSPAESGGQSVTYGASTGSSGGTSLATPGSTNTKTSWTQMTSATTAPARWLMVSAQVATGTTVGVGSGALDVGVGAAASEVVVIADLMYKTDTAERVTFAPVLFPVSIPVGTRIAVRHQNTVASTANVVPRITVTTFA